MYIAPRPPPRPRPRPRGVRPLPPREPFPPRPFPEPPASGVFPDSSSFELSSSTFTSGVSPVEKFADEFRLLLDKGVTQTVGILSRASVIRGSLILELVGSMSTVAGRSSGSSAASITTMVSSSVGGVTSALLRPPRPRPRPRGFCSIVGLSLEIFVNNVIYIET